MDTFNSLRITGVARTITDILGIGAPECAGSALDVLAAKASAAFGGKKADRVLIYNPDAVALWLYQKYTALFAPAIERTSAQLPLLAVMPSVTPVCFASMYTGAMPEVHGIQTYSKPVLKADTVFDAALRAGLKPAIVSTNGDSISEIFKQRDMDYFFFDTPEQCNEKAHELIRADAHDLLVVYNGDYDTTMHRCGPEDEQSMGKLRQNIAVYAGLCDAVKAHWSAHRTMMGFCPDHGCHEIDGKLGSHGLDMPDDMNIIHMYSFV